MKKILFYKMILVLSFLPMLVACSADDDIQSCKQFDLFIDLI